MACTSSACSPGRWPVSMTTEEGGGQRDVNLSGCTPNDGCTGGHFSRARHRKRTFILLPAVVGRPFLSAFRFSGNSARMKLLMEDTNFMNKRENTVGFLWEPRAETSFKFLKASGGSQMGGRGTIVHKRLRECVCVCVSLYKYLSVQHICS